MSFPHYIEQLRYVTAVTEMLNASKLPEEKDFYIKVQLVESGAHEVVGEWSDEIADDCWSYTPASPSK